MKKQKCDICGTELNKVEETIYQRISQVEDVCFCDIAKEIYELQNQLREIKKVLKTLK